MKKSFILILLLLPLLFYSFILPRPTRVISTPGSAVDSSINLLAVYGEYIFGRQGCIRCHVLVENTVPGKISLDGLGGKYTNDWHYMHLNEPSMMVPDSRMPSYELLSKRDISFQKLNQLYQQNSGDLVTDSSAIRRQLSDSMQNIINKFYLPDSKKEALATKEIMPLIYWLQQIKPSPAKKISDSIRIESANRQYANKLYLWKKWMNDHKSEFYQTANSRQKKILEKGARLFQRYCTTCHNKQAQGLIGPNLTDVYWLNGNRIEDLANTIRFGHNAMPAWELVLSPEDISQLIAYIRSLKGSNPANAKVPQGVILSD